MLYEKGIAFKEQIIYIHFGEQHESWYRHVNPNGVVPALQDGDKMIVESEEIINYVDKACPCGKALFPHYTALNNEYTGRLMRKGTLALHDPKKVNRS